MTEHSDNPLLEQLELPPFSRIEPRHVLPAVRTILAEGRARIAEITAQTGERDWDAVVQPMEDLDERLGRVWSPVGHLHSVADSAALREAYNAALPLLSEYNTEVGQNEALYRAYRAVAERDDFAALDHARRKVVEHALRDFRLAGVDLPPADKARYKTIASRLSELGAKFEQNVLDATHAWQKHVTDEQALDGLPASALALARETAERDGKPGWLLTLEFPSYYPVITYANDEALRREVYEAYVTRASDCGPHAGRWDNSEVMAEIVSLRQEMARLLGFASYAEYSLARKMAPGTGKVVEFLEDLAARSLPVARAELDELRAFARDTHGKKDLQAWDIPYYAEKLRQAKHEVSQEALRPYFPVPRVLAGMFRVVERLFGLSIERADGVDTWHPSVEFYRIRGADGELRGQFFLDLYARAHKRGGAWMDECRIRKRAGTEVQIPVAYLVCNFTPPVGGKPSLLTHDEVTTLFHEFGHGLHHLLTRVDYPSVSGINGVPWDAVELPSQFLENWCWEKEALALVSGHVDSGEPVPAELVDRLLDARNFHSGMQMVRQLEFALFDFRLHLEQTPLDAKAIQVLLEHVRAQVAVVIPPEFNRFAHGFTHIFAGGYAAGYYSYKWAEVLSSDAFSRFEEEGVFSERVGHDFLRCILEQGGARDAMELFVEFRGREPRPDALLRHSGIADARDGGRNVA